MELLEGEAEIMPGVRVFETPGHSIGHQSVEIDTATGRYICCGDAIFIMDNTKPIEEIHYDITPPNRFSDIVSKIYLRLEEHRAYQSPGRESG